MVGWEKAERGSLHGRGVWNRGTLEPSRVKLTGSTGHSHHRMFGLKVWYGWVPCVGNGGSQLPPSLVTKVSLNMYVCPGKFLQEIRLAVFCKTVYRRRQEVGEGGKGN